MTDDLPLAAERLFQRLKRLDDGLYRQEMVDIDRCITHRCSHAGRAAGARQPRPTCAPKGQRSRTLLAALFLLAGAMTVIAQQKPDFSGEWKLNVHCRKKGS
jgi:hypothetical protein